MSNSQQSSRSREYNEHFFDHDWSLYDQELSLYEFLSCFVDRDSER